MSLAEKRRKEVLLVRIQGPLGVAGNESADPFLTGSPG